MRPVLEMAVFQQTVLAAETHLAGGLTLKLRCTQKMEKSLIEVEGMCKLSKYKMEGQSIITFESIN
jgi:hypothetical protein